MSRMTMVRESLSATFQNRRLWLIQFLLNPVLAALFLIWLQIPEARVWQLILSVLFAAAIALGILVLHGGTLNFSFERRTIRSAFMLALRHVIALTIWAAIFYFLWRQIDHLEHGQDQFATYLRSEFPAWLRRAVSLPALQGFCALALFILRWILLPGLLLPFALQCAARGFRAFTPPPLKSWGGALKNFSYWIVMICAAIFGVYLPSKLMEWRLNPNSATLRSEIASLIVRLLVAYLLALISWMVLCSMLGRAAQSEVPVGEPVT